MEWSTGNFDKIRVSSNASEHGAGIGSEFSDLKVTNSSILLNTARGLGGGLYATHSSPILINTTIADNIAQENGSDGLWIGRDSHPKIVNSIIWGTSSEHISLRLDSSSILIAYSDIRNGENAITIEPDEICTVLYDSSNIQSEPLFTNPDSGNYEISSSSPCLNAGVAQFIWEGDTLMNLTPDEYMGYAPDMGAVQVGLPVQINSKLSLPQAFTLYHNFPNPFNPSTSIRYAIPVNSDIEIVIYDILGKHVKTLVNAVQPPGAHTITWNGSDASGHKMSAGLYLCRFVARDKYTSQIQHSQVRKMILIK